MRSGRHAARLDEPDGTGGSELDKPRPVALVLVEDQRLTGHIAAQAVAEEAVQGAGLSSAAAGRSVEDRDESHSFSTHGLRWASNRARALSRGVAPPTMTPRRARSIVSSPVSTQVA